MSYLEPGITANYSDEYVEASFIIFSVAKYVR